MKKNWSRSGGGGDSWRGSCYLHRVASEGGADKVTLELGTEESVEEASHVKMWGKTIPNQGPANASALSQKQVQPSFMHSLIH